MPVEQSKLKSLDEMLERQIEYLAKCGHLWEAKALIINWEQWNYDMTTAKKIYWTYELAYKGKTTEF